MIQGPQNTVTESALIKLQTASPETIELLSDIADKFYSRLARCETINLSRLFNRASRQPGDTFRSVFRLACAQFLSSVGALLSDAGAMMGYAYNPDRVDILHARHNAEDAAAQTVLLQRETDSLRLAYLGMMDICGHSCDSLGLTDAERQSLTLHDPSRLHILKQFPGIKLPASAPQKTPN